MVETLAIIGGVETAFGIANNIFKYIEDCRSAKHELQDLATQIELTYGTCGELQKCLEQHEKNPRWTDSQANHARKCIYQCDNLLKRLTDFFLKRNAKVDPSTIDQNFDPSLLQKMSWPLLKPSLRELKLELILVKLDITHALTTRAWSDLKTGDMKARVVGSNPTYLQERRAILKQLYAYKDNFGLESGDEDEKPTSESTSANFQASTSVIKHRDTLAKSVLDKTFEEFGASVRKEIHREQEELEEKEDAERDREAAIKRQYQEAKIAEAKEYITRVAETRSKIERTLDMDRVHASDRQKLINDLVKQSLPEMEMDEYLKAVLPRHMLEHERDDTVLVPASTRRKKGFQNPIR